MHSGSVRSRRTGRTKAGPAQQFPLRLLWKLPREQPSFHQVALLDDYAAIYRDLSRHGLPAELATLVSHAERGSCRRTHTSAIVQWNCSSLFESGVNFEKVEKFSRSFSLLVNFHRSFHPSGSIGALKTRQGPRNDVRYRLTRYRK